MTSLIRTFDAFPKTLDDFRVKTFGGATVTIVSCLLATILFLAELNYYLTPEMSEELLVDVSKDNNRLKIVFDITFPHIGCPYVAIDAIDVSGAQHINLERNIMKRRLDHFGRPIDEARKEQEHENEHSTTTKDISSTLDPNRCESCYGAETSKRKCCNTCQEVVDAYTEKGWALQDYDSVVQCKREGQKKPPLTMTKEGCQTFGYIEVTRVEGNLHFAPGRSLTRHHQHMHDLSQYESQQINSTHIINMLSFGESDVIPGYRNPLDGTVVTADHMSMSFHYYIKIVPTMLETSNGVTFYSSQFAVTQHQRRTDDIMSESSLPGVFFVYEFAPMMVKFTERPKSFLHFLTSVFAIIGGIFTIAGIVDSAVFISANALRKMQLGKQT